MVQVALPGDDDYEKLNFWDMVNLTCPTAGEFSQEVQLNKEEKKYLRENLHKAEETHVRSVVIAKGDCEQEDPRIEGLRQKIHEEYDGVVHRTEVIPNPPRQRCEWRSHDNPKGRGGPPKAKYVSQFW